jgi:SnoaL-like domain
MGERDEEIIARLRRFYEAFNRRDFEAATEDAHPAIELVRPMGSLHGADALRGWMRPDAFEEQQIEPTTTNAFAVGPDPTGALTVARTEVAKGPYLRSLIRLRNPSASPFTGTITWSSNMGSDGAEVTQASSSGDQSFTTADRWVVSSEPGANGFGDDPTVSFVLYGTGARERVDTVISGPGDGELTVDFENLTIPGNGTRYLLFYTEMSASPQVATNAATKYNPRRLSPALLAGIPLTTRNQTLNWDL